MFYITHPSTWSTGNIREFFSQWFLLSYDRIDLTTHVIAVSLKKDTIDTSKYVHQFFTHYSFLLVLAKMRANDKNLIIAPYGEYHQLDSTKIKIKEPNHLFDIDPNNRKSNKRTYVDKDAVPTSVSENFLFFSEKNSIEFLRFCRQRNQLLFNLRRVLIMN